MTQIGDNAFRKVWLVDFEFSAPPGERPRVVCLVAWELRSGATLRIWQDELQGMERPPYAVDGGAVFVAYYASAEMGCHLALRRPLPVNVLDLFT
ncbi:MAG: DNA polymerase I, partial [Pseudomonadota bacterium]|nr:DNA polymerase I [Pseudomonadota bacterium]